MSAVATLPASATPVPVVRPPMRLGGASIGAWALRGVVAIWLVGLVGLPLATLVAKAFTAGAQVWVETLTSRVALEALTLSLWTAALTAGINGVGGLLVAWALVRWEFPGRTLLAALVDLPLAIPTLVCGIVIVALYGPAGVIGGPLADAGLPIAYARPGIVLALVFVTLPFVVRAVEPVIRELDPKEEEAARSLGASPMTTFRRIVLPPLLPAIGSGMIQTFARSVAEFGSLVVVSGNMEHKTLVAPVFVLGEIEGGNQPGAAVASLVLLALALVLHPLADFVARRGGARGRD